MEPGYLIREYTDPYRKKLNKPYQNSAVKAAIDLHYSPDVIARLWKAKSDIEVDRIMRTALERKEYDYNSADPNAWVRKRNTRHEKSSE